MTTKTTILLLTILITITDRTVSDPQTNLLNIGCSQYNASNPADFISKLNQTFSDLRSQINASTRFATAQRPPVYSLFQCRPYLSTSDCLACLSGAVSRIRNCSGNGARVIFDGCFLRYESNSFFDQTTLPGNVGLCSNRTVAAGATAFDSAAVTLLSDLAEATPKIRGYFAAAEGGGTAVYGAAQCAETVSKNGCGDCLAVALGNIKSCPPDAEGRAVDAGCFLRYSVSAFFDSNQTVDLAPFLTSGSSSKNKTAIIGGVVGGVGGGLSIICVLWALWITRFRKPKGTERGDILGATELRGPMNFHYKDLKVSTKNFSEENKLGEGGFGDVYKAWKLYEEDRLMELVDATLDPKDYKADELKRIMEIALLCTQSTVSARPTMSEVVVLLLSKGNAGIQPTRPTFIDATSRVRGDPSTSTSSSNSNATLSISQLSAR
ncbi:Cysteine-rich receptor-like protein kinase 42 [Acorus gramineus]|uniref:Cysteine-rich receptor-like protein kinase 42 n=1 Tax=Acorus gramineus TaxID=55184 RepID=A0AAV9BBT0_ACOGR|nr:Cysteine-rich receptor-like protein kinase 42 [Acorus gramineus]